MTVDRKKTRLEIEKLEAEIAELRKPWYIKVSFIAGISSVLVAMFAVSYGYMSGLFNNQNIFLENKKHDLQNEIMYFQKQKDSLKKSIDISQKKLNLTIDSLLIMKQGVEYANSMMKKLDNDNLQLRSKILSDERIIKIKEDAIRSALSSYVHFVSGYIKRNSYPMAHAIVFAVGESSKFETTTDVNGYFSLLVERPKVYNYPITIGVKDSGAAYTGSHCFDIKPSPVVINIERDYMIYDDTTTFDFSEFEQSKSTKSKKKN